MWLPFSDLGFEVVSNYRLLWESVGRRVVIGVRFVTIFFSFQALVVVVVHIAVTVATTAVALNANNSWGYTKYTVTSQVRQVQFAVLA